MVIMMAEGGKSGLYLPAKVVTRGVSVSVVEEGRVFTTGKDYSPTVCDKCGAGGISYHGAGGGTAYRGGIGGLGFCFPILTGDNEWINGSNPGGGGGSITCSPLYSKVTGFGGNGGNGIVSIRWFTEQNL
jgi:hypothetical protein